VSSISRLSRFLGGSVESYVMMLSYAVMVNVNPNLPNLTHISGVGFLGQPLC
jgi:hypothetical protein